MMVSSLTRKPRDEMTHHGNRKNDKQDSTVAHKLVNTGGIINTHEKGKYRKASVPGSHPAFRRLQYEIKKFKEVRFSYCKQQEAG